MDEKQVINTLLNKENEISNKFHQAISEILRLGYDTEQGQEVLSNLIVSVQYSLEEFERITSIDRVSKVSVDKNKKFKMVGCYEQGAWVCPECGYGNNPYFFKGTCEKCGFEDSDKNKYR